MILSVFYSILETFFIFAAGAFLFHRRIILPDDLTRLTRLTMDVFFPLLTFSVITGSFTREQLHTLWLPPALGFGMMFTGAIAGIFLRRLMFFKTPERIRTFHHICAINNYVFLPIIVLLNIAGEKHVALLLVMNVGSTIGFWTIGVITLRGKCGTLLETLRSVWSVNLAAVLIALIFCWFNIPVFAPAAKSIRALGDMGVPFTLLLVGAALYRYRDCLFKHIPDMVLLSVIRLLLLPLLLGSIIMLLPLEPDLALVTVVVASMPAASSSALVSQVLGGDGSFAGQAVIFTTFLSLATIPLILKIFCF
ncbi:MAG: AEC family transporter [Lentisphaeria bacterium]|nr:AEC family transporter [Lentisphaeria bacterium]